MVIVIFFYQRYVHAICNVGVVASAVELVVAPVVLGSVGASSSYPGSVCQ